MNGLPEVSKDELLDAVKEGVRKAFSDAGICAAISKGVSDGMPWPSEIVGTIGEATHDAIKESRR